MEKPIAGFLITQQEPKGDDQDKGSKMIGPQLELIDHVKMNTKANQDHAWENRFIIPAPISLD